MAIDSADIMIFTTYITLLNMLNVFYSIGIFRAFVYVVVVQLVPVSLSISLRVTLLALHQS